MTPEQQEAINNAQKRKAIEAAKARKHSNFDMPDVQGMYENQYDAMRTILSASYGSMEGGLKGIVEAVNPFSDENPGQVVRDTQEARTLTPQTEGGVEILQGIAEVMQPFEDLKRYLGDQGYELAGPVGGAAGYTAPDALLATVGLKLSKIPSKKAVKLSEIKSAINKGGIGKSLAKYRIADDKVVIDPRFKAASTQGIRENFIGAYKWASPRTKVKMREMVKILKKGMADGIYQGRHRPSEVPGQSLVKRINHLINTNKKAGKRIDLIAKTVLKDKYIDISKVANKMEGRLSDMGVTTEMTPKGTKLNFDGSEFQGATLAPLQKLISEVYNGVNKGKINALQAHRFKRYIDQITTYGKEQSGLTARAESVLKSTRKDLDGILDKNFPQYDKANIKYAKTIDGLNTFQEAVGKKIDLSDAAQLAQKLRSLTNNSVTRGRLIPAMDKIDDIAAQTGAKFTDSIETQMHLANEFDRLFGSTADTSLQGEMVKAGMQAVTGDKLQAAKTLHSGLVNKIKGGSEQAAIKAIEDLIK